MMTKTRNWILFGVVSVIAPLVGVSAWLASPPAQIQALPPGLVAADAGAAPATQYSADAKPLLASFKGQVYRSFCGPSSLATALRALHYPGADQHSVFPSWGSALKTFYSGIDLPGLQRLASAQGVRAEALYADKMDVNQFRDRIKSTLQDANDVILINYDRKALGQDGGGHISPIAAYDPERDSFLVLDEAAYKYPFTWIPAPALYQAAHTKDGQHYRGLLLITKS